MSGQPRVRRGPSDAVLIEARAAGSTYAAIATRHGGSERTLRRRCTELREQIADRHAEMAQEALGQLGARLGEAVDVMVSAVITDGLESTRLRAAEMVFREIARLREKADVHSELQTLPRGGQVPHSMAFVAKPAVSRGRWCVMDAVARLNDCVVRSPRFQGGQGSNDQFDGIAVDPIEFVLSDRYLGKSLYARQATLLKMLYTTEDLFTPYDLDVIGEWIDAFECTGNNGIQPDFWARRKICQEQGRPWFREFEFVGGRRSGKSFIGAVFGTYVLHQYMFVLDPYERFGIDRAKILTGIVLGPGITHAKQNLYADVYGAVIGSPSFESRLSLTNTERLTFYGPGDEALERELHLRTGSRRDLASFSGRACRDHPHRRPGTGELHVVVRRDGLDACHQWRIPLC